MTTKTSFTHIPEAFAANLQAFDVWQAYVLLAGYAPNAWRGGWYFGFPASLSFPETEIAGMRKGEKIAPAWSGRQDGAETSKPHGRTCGTLFNRFSYRQSPKRLQASGEGDSWLFLDINLPGVLGPGGPMPLHFCETVIQENRDANRGLQEFLDIFQNRLMRLWMQDASVMCSELGPIKRELDDLPLVAALAVAGIPTDVSTPHAPAGNSSVIASMRRRSGLPTPTFSTVPDSPPERQGNDCIGSMDSLTTDFPLDVFFATSFLWAKQPPSATGLEILLKKCLGVTATVEQFRGEWRNLPEPRRVQLGTRTHRLGDDAFLGKSIFDFCRGLMLRILDPSRCGSVRPLPVARLGRNAWLGGDERSRPVVNASYRSVKKNDEMENELHVAISWLATTYVDIEKVAIIWMIE